MTGDRFRGLLSPASVILLVAFGLLLGDAIRSRSIRYDEAITLLETSGHGRPDWPEEATPAAELQRLYDDRAGYARVGLGFFRGVHPPLYSLIALWWRNRFGSGLEELRVLSALLAAAQIPLLLRLTAGMRYPAGAAALFALSASAIVFGETARNYALASFLLLVGAAASTGRRSMRKSGLAVAACAAALATHYFAIFAVGALAAIWIARFRRERSAAARLPAFALPTLLAAVIPFLLHAASIRPKQMAGSAPWATEIAAFARTLGAVFAESAAGPDSWVGTAAAVAVCGALIAAVVRTIRRREQDEPASVLVAMFCAQALGLAFAYALFDKTFTAPQAVRYIALALPAGAATVVYGIEWAPRWGAAALLAGFLLLEASGLRAGQDRPGTTPREAAAEAADGRVVVVGAGHGRGTPGAMVYELDPGARVCVITGPESCRDHLDGSIVVQSSLYSNPRTKPYEEAFAQDCIGCSVVSVAERW